MELRCHSCEWHDQCGRDEKDGQTTFGTCGEYIRKGSFPESQYTPEGVPKVNFHVART